ncbi:IS200/IS605 family accessory protein TnpB-related protein [Scytonema hofmannii]|uniref:IS200/IS605 family accessory protein TnpB-related protein n=1 Tax=Scytonema hofmannii TaxID=34078 RepID=UPI000349033A|nr:IS200/IS605 family accessory protein TnpB-related protein [Scytonema hofmannii]
MPKVTIQTTIPKIEVNTKGLQYLDEYHTIFGQAIRKGFSLRNQIGKTTKKESSLEKLICKELETEFGLSNSEAKNAYNKASAVYSSQAELVDRYIDDNYARIKGIRKSIGKLRGKLKKAVEIRHSLTAKYLTKQIHFKEQHINKLLAKIERLKESKDSGKFTVTFGSSKLFKAQYNLEANGYSSHEDWLEDWQKSRSSRSFFVGSKNFHFGNQLARYNPELGTLTITVSPSLQSKYGDRVTLHEIKFHREGQWLTDAIKPTVIKSTRKGKDGEKFEIARNGSEQPVTYEIVDKDGSLYINATVNVQPAKIESSLANGAFGVDFNPGSIDWTVIDRHGNLKRHGSIKINVQDKRSKQTKDVIGKAVAEIVRIASHHGVPVVIENLDFTKKKASMKELGVKYARMLSNMAYSQFHQMIETRCSRFGVELILVDPAYTSIIGVTKYLKMYALSSGCAAALVIARRSQGRAEKVPSSVRSYFRKPEDMLRSGAWAKVAKKSNTVGGFNRNKFYFCGSNKKVPTNGRMHGLATANKYLSFAKIRYRASLNDSSYPSKTLRSWFSSP